MSKQDRAVRGGYEEGGKKERDDSRTVPGRAVVGGGRGARERREVGEEIRALRFFPR